MVVGGNVLTGNIPSELGLLTVLEEIVLGDNNLIGNIPTKLGLISGLKQIELNNNDLTGPIPTELGSLTLLETITLGEQAEMYSYCTFESCQARWWILLILFLLYEVDCELSGTLPSELGAIETLLNLNLGEYDVHTN